MKNKDIFASNLRITKHRLNYSQQQMANKMGVKRCTVAAWLEGRGVPGLEDQPKLIEVLKIEDWKTFITIAV